MTSPSPIISSNVSLRQEPSHMMAHANGPGSTLGQHYQHHVTHGQRGHSVLVEGKLLQGEALLEYAQQKGLCPKCVQHVTHKRVRKKVGMLRYTFEWIPLTCTDEQAGNYTVYKGYCLQPTCFTLEEAQNLLGEHQRMRITRSTSRGRVHNRASQSRSSSKARPSFSKSRSRRDLGNAVSNSMSNTSHHSSISGASSEADGDTDRDFESDDYDVECVAMSQSESFTDSSTRPITPTSSIPNSPSSGDVQHIQQQPNRQRLMQPQLLTNQRLAMQRSPGRTLSCHNLDANSCRTPRASDRTKRRVPDSDILRQLCRLLADLNNDTPSGHGGVNSRRGIAKGKSARGPLSVASESDLWTILHKRYGEETLPALTIPGRIVVILSILHKPFVMEGSNSDDNKEHNECSEPAWTLLAHLTKQQLQLANSGEDDNELSNLNSETSPKQKARFAEQVLRQISNEFDRTDAATTDSHHSSSDLGYAKRCAAQTLYYMLKNEERCVDSPVFSGLQALSPTKRHHWITVLLDMLLFNGDDDDQLIGSGDEAEHKNQAGNTNTTGTAENLYLVWNLLLADDADTTSTHDNLYVLKTIVGIAASILSNYSTDDGCCCNGLYSSSRGASIIESVLQIESAMGLLATVASRAGATALAGRQYECLQAISETCTRYDDVEDVLLQGSLATCQILASFEWYHDDSSGGGSINESTELLPRCYAAAEHVLDVVSLVLEYQKKRFQRGLPKPEGLNRAVCRLLTTLLESNEILQTFVVRVCLQQEQLVSSLVQMLGTTSILSIAESASDILVYMLNRDATTSKCFRETPDIAAVVVHAMNHYREAPVLLENLCVIVAHLASLQDRKLGQEITAAGGINVLADLLMNPPLQGSQYPDDSASMIEVALRALTGIISSIDIKLLHSYQASLVDVFISVMDRQHQQHRIFQCATDTENRAYEFDINWDCNLALQVQLAVLDALHVLCVRGATDDVSRAIQLVLYNMEFYSEQVEVLTRCCAIIRRLTRKLSENPSHIADVIATLEATKWGFSLLRAMMFHPDATELVLEGMATLKDLTAMPCFRDLFEPSDAEACLVSLLDVASGTRPDVTALAFAALNNVLVDRRLRPSVGPVSEDVVIHMLGALRRFPDDVEVWTNSLLLLKSYTYRDDNLAILHDSFSDELIPLLIDSERILSGDALERATYIIRKLQ